MIVFCIKKIVKQLLYKEIFFSPQVFVIFESDLLMKLSEFLNWICLWKISSIITTDIIRNIECAIAFQIYNFEWNISMNSMVITLLSHMCCWNIFGLISLKYEWKRYGIIIGTLNKLPGHFVMYIYKWTLRHDKDFHWVTDSIFFKLYYYLYCGCCWRCFCCGMSMSI